MQRIERDRPDAVVVNTGTDDGERYAVKVDGRRLSRDDSEPYLEDGLVRTLRRIKGAGATPVVIRDLARTPDDIVDCVAEHPDALDECSFKPDRNPARSFDAVAAHRVKGARLLDPLRVLCPDSNRCPAVIGDALVYRNEYHLTATFAETMAPWLRRGLPDLELGD